MIQKNAYSFYGINGVIFEVVLYIIKFNTVQSLLVLWKAQLSLYKRINVVPLNKVTSPLEVTSEDQRIDVLVKMVDNIISTTNDDDRSEQWGDLLTVLGYTVDDFL